ncbi:MAG: phosphotransferase [Myxococcales bacterium]|nr:phosphotransferase [Myxococcales bacterium]
MDVDAGLINHTVGVARKGRLLGVLQRLNTSIFRPEVHRDIEAVTAHLQRRGLPTPRIVPTQHGGLWHTDDDGGCLRLLTPIGTRTHLRATPPLAREAGALVARFHTALVDLEHVFAFTRPGAHDTEAHLQGLRMALMLGRGHRLYREVADLADGLLDAWDTWHGPTDLPVRIVHGDLKISNVLFDDDDRAVALIDLDTLAHGTLDVELGDALRSWCNPAGENVADVRVDLDVFRAAVTGYLGEATVAPEERESIVPGLERIALELAARFARDALEESYFGYDPAFGGRGEHNLLRARGQAALARSVAANRSELEAVIRSS